MTEFNRSKFKGTTLNTIKGEQERAEKALPRNNGSGNRPGFHTIEDGKNWRRIAPAHSPDEPAYRAKSTVFLECEVPEIDEDGKETGKKEVKRKNIFIATQHSKVLKEDPILLYIQFVQKRANDEIQDKDARAKFMSPINGWRSKDGKWNWGIKPSLEYICYAWDDLGELGREQLYPSMLDQMKKLSIQQSDDNAEIVPDIFTDPDEGFPLIITKSKNDKGKYELDCSCDMPTKKETWVEFFSRVRLTDEQLTDLMSRESLRELYEDVYTTRDFNMAVDGLMRFDKQHKYGIFENEEFIQHLTKIKRQVPEYKSKEEYVEKEDTPEQEKEVEAKAISTKEEQQSENKITTPIPAMKRILREYIQENYGSDYVLPELERNELEKWYMLCQKGEELPFDNIQKDTSETTSSKNIVADVKSKTDVKEESSNEKTNTPPVNSSSSSEISDELRAQIDKLRSRRVKK